MGLTYSDFRRNYYNQVCRRLERQYNANAFYGQQLRPYNDYNLYKRNYFWRRDEPYRQQSAFPYNNYDCELNRESLLLEEMLHATAIQRHPALCYTQPPTTEARVGLSRSNSKAVEEKSAAGYFRAVAIRPFIREQRIRDIRSHAAAGVFQDRYFPPHSNVFGPASCSFLKDFSKQLPGAKWERTATISYHKGLVSQFVLNSRDHCSSSERYNGSVSELFQGSLASSFFLAAVLAMTRNSELMAHVAPVENGSEANVSKGAFNFRFWRLGEWYDLVVDDYLVCDAAHNILFTRNLSSPNEYWICLLEKAFAK
jgi:hypothetical protein